MPIHRSKSPKAFQENIKREEKYGRGEKQAVKVAYEEADLAKKRDAKARLKYRDGIAKKIIHGEMR